MAQIKQDDFGTAPNPVSGKEEAVIRVTLSNNNMEVQVITLGATITSIKVPDIKSNIKDVLLGFDNPKDYILPKHPYFGSTIGRVCNRVLNGEYKTPKGDVVKVTKNLRNKFQLHGGFLAFDKMHWKITGQSSDSVTMQVVSPDGHEGYPGECTVTLTYHLPENENRLNVKIEGHTTKETPINLTNHAYFNLAGHETAKDKNALFQHMVQISADRILDTDEENIPTGKFIDLNDQPKFDLRKMSNLGEKIKGIQDTLWGGYDNCYCLLNTDVVAKAYHPGTGIMMEMFTNQPGMQFYNSNFLPDPEKNEPLLDGKGGAKYGRYGAFCMETENYPAAMNYHHFPNVFLKPGEKYVHTFAYKFSTVAGKEANYQCTC